MTSPVIRPESRPLDGRTALVTGASRGIGAAIARRLARDGARVIVHYGSGAEEAAAVVAAIRAEGGRADAVQADLAQSDGPFQLFERAAPLLASGGLDVLVNNAGVAAWAPLADTTPEDFDRLVAVNVRGLYFATRQALRWLPDGARIVNLSSVVARAALPGLSAYASTKGFVDVLTLHLAQELAPRGILVNAVAPGAIDTRMSAWVREPGGTDTLERIQALRGVGQPEHVAAVVAFLAGPDGAWTTGQVIDASGGTRL